MLKQRFLPILCLMHMAAIFWWTVPRNFQALQSEEHYDNTAIFLGEHQFLAALSWSEYPRVQWLLKHYIDLTGSQQYWDFFAPAVPKFHQYFTLCDGAFIVQPTPERWVCTQTALFTNFNFAYNGINIFQTDDSRHYRLTENLSTLHDPQFLNAFVHSFHLVSQSLPIDPSSSYSLIMHRFELYPGLAGMPAAGYQVDSLAWVEKP